MKKIELLSSLKVNLIWLMIQYNEIHKNLSSDIIGEIHWLLVFGLE